MIRYDDELNMIRYDILYDHMRDSLTSTKNERASDLRFVAAVGGSSARP